MRIRPLAALSTVALATLLLAGCTGGGDVAASPSPDASGSLDLCAAAAPSGAASDSITVDGEVGEPATATFTFPLEVTTPERTVLVEGDGEPIANGDLVNYAATIFDASTGEQLTSIGYDPAILPVPVTVATGPDSYFGCAPTGSRIVMALPGAEGSPAVVWVLDALSTAPAAADGEEQEPVDGLPTVELADDGAPTITLPDSDAPTELQLEVLKKGDGAEVISGDTVLVHYTGMKWSDGSIFDSSWEKGAPTQFPTTGVVPGFQQALEGQTVGSQVVVVIPPALGYGEGEINDADLKGETLVFVVDILGTQAATAGQ